MKKAIPETFAAAEGGILVIDKPAGWTSFEVVKKVRRLTGIKKVGHAGTLDPFATGVLVICLGPATKQSSRIMNFRKEYLADIALGRETDTMDLTGRVVRESAVPLLEARRIREALDRFRGEIEQEIPSYSAAKFKGRRLYKLARKGIEIPRLFKKVRVYDIELLDWGGDFLKICVECGRGTYIRTLARDIARILNTAGHVKRLVRTRVGGYTLKNALSITEFENLLKATETYC